MRRASLLSPGGVLADIGTGTSLLISAALATTRPDGGTPTHTTLSAALSYIQGNAANPAGQYVLLATDGEPNCGDPNDNNEPTVTESVDAIEQLAGAGVPTFVLGFGGTVNNQPATLRAMAEAGGTGDYFAANDTQQLATALDAIASEVGVVSCSLRLNVEPQDESLLAVSQDGSPVARDGADGWTYDAGTNSITFHGSACDRLKGGAVAQVEIDLGCTDCAATCDTDSECAGIDVCADGCCGPLVQ